MTRRHAGILTLLLVLPAAPGAWPRAAPAPAFSLVERGDLEDLTARVGDLLADELGRGPVTGSMTAHVVEATT